jgi:Uma2 family endonuclease
MTVVTTADELALDVGTDSPLARSTFTHWPLPVGRVEIRDGLAFVHSAEPGGFTADDYRRIPDEGRRIELLDGVVVVSPSPARPHQRAVTRLTVILDRSTPPSLETLVGPYDIRVRPVKVFEPDLLVLPRDDDQAALLVVEVLSKYGRSYDRRVKRSEYQAAGIPSYWIIDPDAPSVTVLELSSRGSYREAEFFHGNDTCVIDRPFPVRFRPSDLT